jgi:hypothetical protein
MSEIFAVDEFIQGKLREIEAATELKTEVAFALANEVAEAVTEAILEAQEARQFERVEELARQAEEAYLLAADKVPSADRDKIAFVSTYWSLKVDYARLDAETARRPTPYQPPPRPAEEPDKAKELTFISLGEAKPEEKRARVPDKPVSIGIARRERRSEKPGKAKEPTFISSKERKPAREKEKKIPPALFKKTKRED